MDNYERLPKNRFALKLTLSIIAIVIGVPYMFGLLAIGIPIMTLAVLACVYTCLQNRDFQDGYWEGFQKNCKMATIFLWISYIVEILISIICAVVVIWVLWSKTNFFEGVRAVIEGYRYEEPADDDDINDLEGGYVDMVDGFETFSMDGADITLPITLKDFMDAGFYLKEDDLQETIEEHNSYSYPYYRTEDEAYLGTIFIYNTTSRDSKVEDGIVGGLTINKCENMDFEIVGGLTFGSSPDEAFKVLGTDVTEKYKDGTYSYYTWQFTHGYATSIELDYDENKLDEVWIMNYATLSDY